MRDSAGAASAWSENQPTNLTKPIEKEQSGRSERWARRYKKGSEFRHQINNWVTFY
jgi:hypothetical protein